MLNVTNRSWKFGVGRKVGYQGTPIKEGTLFFSLIYTLSEFCSILGLPIGELLTLWLQDVAFSTVAQSS